MIPIMARPRLLVARALAILALAGTARSARATASARLVYLRGPGAEQCPGEQAVRAAVSARLGYDPFFAWAHETVFAEIQRESGAFHAVVKLVDENNLQRGIRAISAQGDDCSAIIDAVALSISLTIDPSSLVGGSTAPAQAPPAPPPNAPSIARAAKPPRPPDAEQPAAVPAAPAPAANWSLHGGLGAMGSLRTAPAPSVGALLFVGLRWRALSLDLEGRAYIPSSGEGDQPPGLVSAWLVAGSVVPCLHVGVAFGCAVTGVGGIGASAQGVARSFDSFGPWSAAGARLGAEWVEFAPRFSARAFAEWLGTIARDDFYVDRVRVYTIPPWSAGIGVVVAWRFR